MNSFYKNITFIALFILLYNNLNAQITCDTGYTPTQLAWMLTGGATPPSNVSYTGTVQQRSKFTADTGILPADSGVFLTSGSFQLLDTISSILLSSDYGVHGGAPDLAAYFGVNDTVIRDLSSLEFNMTIQGDSVQVEFFFASEEYNEFVNSTYADGFAIFISGPGIPFPENFALVPGTTLPVTINNINNGQTWVGPSPGPCMNCSYYNDNWNGTDFTFDGFTTLMRGTHAIQSGQTYHIKIIIADLMDGIYDTGVFLKAGSLYGINTLCTGYGVDASPEDSSICQGTIQLSAIATTINSVYQWSPANGLDNSMVSNPVASNIYQQEYVVTAIDTVLSCVATDTILITALSNFSEIKYNCGNYTYDLFLPDSATSYNWFSFIDTANVPHLLTDTSQFITVSEPGIYAGTANFPGCSINGYFELLDTCSATPRVWPGDCNYDLVANNVDFLYIGLAYIDVGPGRTPYSIAWQPFFCNNWQNVFANGINHKHADCNGDGAVEIIDTLAISQNYGLTHPFRISSPQNSATNYDLKLVANKDTAGLNDQVIFDLVAGSLAQPLDSLYGIAYTLNFNQGLITTSQTSISYTPSVLGTINTNMYSFTKDFFSSGIIDAALCRTDYNDATIINGSLGKIAMTTAGTVTSVQTFILSLSNVFAITSEESVVLFNLVPDSVVIDPGFVGVNELNIADSELSVFPNPAHNNFTVKSGSKIKEFILLNAEGRKITKLSPLQDTFSVDTRNIPAGFYIAKVLTNDRAIYKKVQILSFGLD